MPTASPTPTLTPEPPAPAYLPLALLERCEPKNRRADVMLVLDASSSMQDSTSTGRRKIEAAVEAAGRLIDALDFDAGDRVGLVVFNEEVTVDLPLASDGAALATVLAGIRTSPGTCIPCGIEAGLQNLAKVSIGDAGRVRSRALLLLTDGHSTIRSIEEAVDMVHGSEDKSLYVFTIGLGEDVEELALRRMVSKPAFYHNTLDAEALANIFENIVAEIPCSPSNFWAGR